MKQGSMRWLALNLSLLCSVTSQSQPQTQIPTANPLTTKIPVAPIPVKSESGLHLLYELHLLNSGAGQLEITRLEVLKGDSSVAMLASYQETELSSRLEYLDDAPELPNKRVVPGGMRALVFLHLMLDTEADLPPALRHRLFFKSGAPGENGGERMVEGASVGIQRSPPLAIGPPLRGKNWLAANGLSNDSNHRRAVISRFGKAPVPCRFAIDWAKLGADGLPYHTDPSKNTNYYGYGAEVLAVADAVVVSVKDGMPENIPTAKEKAVPFSIVTAGGNSVMLDLGNGRFAFYAHLQPRSLRVKVGAKVRRGQALALLGNSGNSTGPHLHFQIVDANSPVFAEGMPFVFESFEMEGELNSLLKTLERSGRWKPKSKAKVDKRRMEMPISEAVVHFP